MASAQTNYDEEHEGESFTLVSTLNQNKSYHYKALERIVFGNGFSYTPSGEKKSLFEIDETMLIPPTYGTDVSTANDPNLAVQAPAGLPYSLPMK